MNILVRSTNNEFYKLIKRKKYIVLLIISILICLGRVGGGLLISKLSHGIMDFNKTSGIIMEMFPFFSMVMVPLVVFMAATDLFASEIQDSTMKAVLMRPITRFKIMTSKVLAVFFIGVIYYLMIFITCAILELLFGKVTFSYMMQSFGAYLIDMIPLFNIVLLGVVVNLLSKTPSLAMFLSIVVYAVMKYCNYFMPVLNSVLFTSYSQWHNLWIGSTLPLSALAPKIGVIIGSGIVLYVVGYVLFDRKEY